MTCLLGRDVGVQKMHDDKDVAGDGFQGMAMTCGYWCEVDCRLAPDAMGWSLL